MSDKERVDIPSVGVTGRDGYIVRLAVAGLPYGLPQTGWDSGTCVTRDEASAALYEFIRYIERHPERRHQHNDAKVVLVHYFRKEALAMAEQDRANGIEPPSLIDEKLPRGRH